MMPRSTCSRCNLTDRKPIDPALRRYLDETAKALAALPAPANNEERVALMRAILVRALGSRQEIAGLPNAVETREVSVQPGLDARLYLPAQRTSPLPVVVYLHGGGWVAGSVATHDPFCRLLCERTGAILASIEYRRAPEHHYPAALEDGFAALTWAAARAREWGGDTSTLAIGGDSAGAGLAAAVANRWCADKRSPKLAAQLLLFPVTDHPVREKPSYRENASGYGLEAKGMRWYWDQYATEAEGREPDASPLQLKEIPALPPTLVTTAEYDVLRDDGILYAEKLKAAGVAVTQLHSPDMSHNFPISPGLVARFPQCIEMLDEIARWLRTNFAT